MKRDLESYRDNYLKNYGFEKYQVHYRQKQIQLIAESLSPKRILEVGCGIDTMAHHLNGWEHYTVVEPVQKFIEINKQSSKDSVHFINKTLEDAVDELTGQDFDFIIISSLIHELENPEKILKSAHSLCSSNTNVHINVPNSKSVHKLLGLKMGLIQNPKELSELAKDFQRHREYDLQDLCQLAVKNGFAVTEKGSYFLKPLSHKQMMGLLEDNKISEAYLDALFAISGDIPEFGSEIFVNLQRDKT